MKLAFRRWLLSRRLRSIQHELDYVFDVRLQTLKREAYLKGCAEAVRIELLHFDIRGRRHA